MVLNFEKEKLISELKQRTPKRVLVQLPEGIKTQAPELQKDIEDLGIEVIFSGETAWGGCCIALQEAKDAGCDLIVHFGHAPFINVDFPVLYIEVRDELDLTPFLERSLEALKPYNKISLSYSVQHKHDIPAVIEFYKQNGKEVLLSQKQGYAAYEGHVVGCEYRGLRAIEPEVDAFVVLGNNFHSMGAALAVNKPVFLIDVYNAEITEMKGVKEKIMRERAISIDKLKDARVVGIIQELKPGQKFGPAKLLKEKLEAVGKQALIITMNEMTPDKIHNFYNIDAFVELACPRIAIDDFSKYEKPILTYKEALVALGEKSWDELVEGGFL